MLTWKIFVIIMSMAPLTLINVNSSGRGYSSRGESSSDLPEVGTPRPDRSRTRTEPYTSSLLIYNPVNGVSLPWRYNPYNPFNESNLAFNCYQQIKLFCDNEKVVVQNSHCIQKGMLYYKEDLQIKRDEDNYENLENAVYVYFSTLKFKTGGFNLPKKYCRHEADLWMANRRDQQRMINFPQLVIEQHKEYEEECMRQLAAYENYVQDPRYVSLGPSNEVLPRPESEVTQQHKLYAVVSSRYNIARFAIVNKSLLDMVHNSFEWDYLSIISKRTSVLNNENNPFDFCRNPANNPINMAMPQLQ